MQCVCPPNVLADTSAGALHDALVDSPTAAPFVEAEAKLRAAADHNVLVVETDRASSNKNVLHNCFDLHERKSHVIWKPCSPHGNSLAEASAIAIVGIMVLSNMYSAVSCLQMGSNYARFVAAVDKLEIRISREPPPVEAAVASSAIIEYLFDNFIRMETQSMGPDVRFEKEAGQRSGRFTDSRAEELNTFLRELFAILNGAMHGKVIWHHCLSQACCCNYNRIVLTNRLKEALRKTTFRCKPSRPEAAKWAKLGPSLDVVCHFTSSTILENS